MVVAKVSHLQRNTRDRSTQITESKPSFHPASGASLEERLLPFSLRCTTGCEDLISNFGNRKAPAASARGITLGNDVAECLCQPSANNRLLILRIEPNDTINGL